MQFFYTRNTAEELSWSRYEMSVHRDRIRNWSVGFWGGRQIRESWEKPLEQGKNQNTKQITVRTSCTPPQPPLNKNRKKKNKKGRCLLYDQMCWCNSTWCKRHTVFATLTPKTILYNFNSLIAEQTMATSIHNSRKRQIIENKESGKMFETLHTQYYTKKEPVFFKTGNCREGHLTPRNLGIPRMDVNRSM